MNADATLWLGGIGIAVALAAILGERARRRAPLAWHAHLPWNGLAFGGIGVALLAVVHGVNLLR